MGLRSAGARVLGAGMVGTTLTVDSATERVGASVHNSASAYDIVEQGLFPVSLTLHERTLPRELLSVHPASEEGALLSYLLSLASSSPISYLSLLLTNH